MSDGKFSSYEDLCAEVNRVIGFDLESRQCVKDAIWEGKVNIRDRESGEEFSIDRFRDASPQNFVAPQPEGWECFEERHRCRSPSRPSWRDLIIGNPNFLFERVPVLLGVETLCRDFLGGRRLVGAPEPMARDQDEAPPPPTRRETRGRKKTKGLPEAEVDLIAELIGGNPASLQSKKAKLEWLRNRLAEMGFEPPESDSTLYEAVDRAEAGFLTYTERSARISESGGHELKPYKPLKKK